MIQLAVQNFTFIAYMQQDKPSIVIDSSCVGFREKYMHSNLDVLFEVLPGDCVCDALVNIVKCLLEYPGGHVLLLLVLIQHFQQHLVRKEKVICYSPLLSNHIYQSIPHTDTDTHLLCSDCISFKE